MNLKLPIRSSKFVNCNLPIEKDGSVGHQIWGLIQ